ncbi:hypothetical protein ABBQ32_004474 [Trebouxia sp. C0010 RCD-2024]
MHQIYGAARDMGKWTPNDGLDKVEPPAFPCFGNAGPARTRGAQVPMKRRSFDHADPSELLIKMLEAIDEGGVAQRAFTNHLLGSIASLHSKCEDCCTQESFQEEHICRLPLLDSSGEVCSDICTCLDRFVAEDRAEGASDCDVCSR